MLPAASEDDGCTVALQDQVASLFRPEARPTVVLDTRVSTKTMSMFLRKVARYKMTFEEYILPG